MAVTLTGAGGLFTRLGVLAGMMERIDDAQDDIESNASQSESTQ